MTTPRRIALMLDLENPFKRHVRIFAGAQRYALEQGWESIVDEYADDTLASVGRNPPPYHGIIARATSLLARQAMRFKLPVVNIWISSPAWKSLPGVFPDWLSIGRLQADHLLARGYRRFAGLTVTSDRSQALLMNAFLQTVGDAGCSCTTTEIALFPADSAKKWRVTERAISTWMNAWKPPIGVCIPNETTGRIVAQMCRVRNWRIPQDVAIITGMNEELLCEGIRPTLSSTEIGFDRVGYEAARLLDRLMAGEKPPGAPLVLPAQGLVIRESTDFVAVDDSLISSAMAFIAANFHHDIHADDVAEFLKVHPRKLQRQFREYLGKSISSEIRAVRIERAKHALTQTRHPLSQIARAVGFGSVLRMCATFQREVGVSPKQYRLERQGVT